MKVRNILTVIAVCITGLATPADTEDKRVVGWLENVMIYPERLSIRAKLDTGARHPFLNAPDKEDFFVDASTQFTINPSCQGAKRL